VKEILEMTDGAVRALTTAGEVRGKWLLDASGPGTVVARHLGTRVNASEPQLQKVAYYGHFEGVHRLPGSEEGHPLIVMCDEGWFWVIPLNERVTSVGLVLDAHITRSLGVPATELLDWGIRRCPILRQRMREAAGPIAGSTGTVADFTYRCRPYAGPGYFLLGDAAAFMDPIFSTGVCLGMMSAAEAVRQIVALSKLEVTPEHARRQYIRYVEGSTGVFFKLIRSYYEHGFREMFLNGSGPLKMHRAILSILAGHIFPRPPWKLRWRLWLFYVCLRLQRKVAMVKRRKPFSLRAEEPKDWGAASTRSAAGIVPSLGNPRGEEREAVFA
jgi:2-polyprenyl-6-methoxyphenol hydroxylase-like FAD-dependent oxidoreductase